MWLELIIFISSLALGFLFRGAFLINRALCKKLKNKPATVVLEIIVAGIFVCALGAVLFFFNDGVIAIYAVFAGLIGFVIASLIR